MATADDMGLRRRVEQAIEAQRAKLFGAHAVQRCLYEVLLYADGEDAVVYADAAQVVAATIGDVLEELDSVHIQRVMDGSGT